MFIIRPLKEIDYETLLACAMEGKGMTSLPKDPTKLKALLKLSLASFKGKGVPPNEEYYGFILENYETHSAAGVSAIKAIAGKHKTFRFYHLENNVLIPERSAQESSELCSLYLLRAFRKEGMGKLLSLSRLHFITTFPERFKPDLMAELRGYVNEAGLSPFWEAIGKKLSPFPYEKAAMINAEGEVTADTFFSQTPILISSLPEEAISCIGKTYSNTLPARLMLEKEGFKWSKRMDIVDGGPQFVGSLRQLNTYKNSQLFKVHQENLTEINSTITLISNNRLDFRAVLSQFKKRGREILLPQETKEALLVKPGDWVRI